jgi:ectoine hydroxylase-related dioxygenase (phytanoyl-CoA dioxygenase family)
MIKKIYNYFVIVILFPIFIFEVLKYKFFKIKNSELSYQYMIKLFTIFDGHIIKIISKFLSQKKVTFTNNYHNTSLFINCDYNKINDDLLNCGYYIHKNKIDKKLIDAINSNLVTINGKYCSDSYSSNNYEEFDPDNPKGAKFIYETNALIKIAEIQNLLLDKQILTIAQNYLNALPIIDIVTAWWSSPSKFADKNAAQFWHFDMDRPRWLKVFIFLTDCNISNGPHCFIEGSHKDNGIPNILRSKGYQRLSDEEISSFYSQKKVKTFVATKGSILFEDTRGLHKGIKLESGNRLILQFQYSTALFGSTIEKIKLPRSNFLLDNFNKNKEIFQNFY